MAASKKPESGFSPYKPQDYFRLLWQALRDPLALDSEGPVGNLLALALMFVPLLLPLIGLALELVPRNALTSRQAQAYPVWAVAMVAVWLVCGLVAMLGNDQANNCAVGFVMFCVAVGYSIAINRATTLGALYLGVVVLALIVANRVTSRIGGVVAGGICVGLISGTSTGFAAALLRIAFSAVESVPLRWALYVPSFLGLSYLVLAAALVDDHPQGLPPRTLPGIFLVSWLALAFSSLGGLLWLQGLFQ